MTTTPVSRNAYFIMAGIVLLVSAFMILSTDSPGYTDAYYYFNAGKSLAAGDGLTDHYLWNYINAPDSIPTESHRYWMPLASLVVAVPMFIFGTDFDAAQIVFVPFLIGLVWLSMWLAGRISGKTRHIWAAGLMTLFGGFYFPFWLTTDTFAVYGLLGALCLVALGLGRTEGKIQWFVLAGALAGLAHLARADGLLFLIAGMVVIWIPNFKGAKLTSSLALIIAYIVVMLPWFVRNMHVLGSPLPSGGIGTMFLHEYNDLFNYPAEWSLQYFLDWGAGNIFKSRLEGLLFAFENWLAVEGLILIAPLGLWALWQRRRDGIFAGVIWYVIGLHAAMALVFTYPGTRGGLFHSSAALYPFWVVTGLVGLEDGVARVARWRKWRTGEAQMVFGTAVILIPLALGWFAWNAQAQNRDSQPDYRGLADNMPEDAQIMVNDPAAWFYFTGLSGVTLPDASLDTALEIAQKYCISYLVIDRNVTGAFKPLIQGESQPPDFLHEVVHLNNGTPDDFADDTRIYRFDVEC